MELGSRKGSFSFSSPYHLMLHGYSSIAASSTYGVNKVCGIIHHDYIARPTLQKLASNLQAHQRQGSAVSLFSRINIIPTNHLNWQWGYRLTVCHSAHVFAQNVTETR